MRKIPLLVILAVLFVTPAFADSQCRSPAAVGPFDGWTLGAGSTKVSAVTDTIASDCSGISDDGDTDYIQSASSFDVQDWTYTAFSITSSAITSVEVCVVVKEIAEASMYLSLRINGSNYDSAQINSITGSYTQICNTWTTNPDTSSAWTEADVEGTGSNPIERFFVLSDNVGSGDEIRVTQTYIKVNYTAAGGGGGTGYTTPRGIIRQ